MQTIIDIFIYFILAGVLLIALSIFVQTGKELWEDIKDDISGWLKTTRVGMNWYNRKNGITILSDSEYERLLASGKIIPIEMKD